MLRVGNALGPVSESPAHHYYGAIVPRKSPSSLEPRGQQSSSVTSQNRAREILVPLNHHLEYVPHGRVERSIL